jgi:hypothetical protein
MRDRTPPVGEVQNSQAFWTLIVGVPAAVSVLRLWVESGGELQTTLLLVSNVGPLNLGAALFATTSQLATVVLIAAWATTRIVQVAVENTPETSPLREHPPLITRLPLPPLWGMLVTYFVAVLTWKILYIPLLVPAYVAMTQRPPWRWHYLWQVAAVVSVVSLIGYGVLVLTAVRDAVLAGEWQVALLLALPPVVAFGIAGPMADRLTRSLATVMQLAVVSLAAAATVVAVQAPLLPLVVTEVGTSDRTELLRGHVISVDDKHLALLEERGGVRYLPINDVHSVVLCATPEELPAFTTRVLDFHVEDSLLSALGREKRSRVQVDPLCRITSSRLLPDGS